MTPAVDAFQRIWAFVAKLLPVAVSVKLPAGADTDVGEIEISVGVLPEGLVKGHALTRNIPSIVPSPVA